MKRTPLTRGQPIRRTGRVKPVNKARRQKELLRTYGAPARRKWVKSLCCIVCNAPPPSEQSHIRSRSGAGRKGDADKVVPMCAACHLLYPQVSKWRKAYPLWPDARLQAAAKAVEFSWQHGLPYVQTMGDLYWEGYAEGE